MDSLEMQQLLLHSAVRKLDLWELCLHGITFTQGGLRRSTVTGQLALVLLANSSIQQQHKTGYDTLSSTVLYRDFNIRQCGPLIVGKVVDLIIIKHNGEASFAPVFVSRPQLGFLPLVILSHLEKRALEAVRWT